MSAIYVAFKKPFSVFNLIVNLDNPDTCFFLIGVVSSAKDR